MTYATPDYQFFIRNLRTLAVVDEIAPQDIRAAKWTRAHRGGGSWDVSLPRNSRYTPALLVPHQVLHVVRNGVTEFAGVLERRKIDRLAKTWTIGGPDLTAFWLAQRIVGATATDDRNGVGETVLKAYIENHLGASAAAARRMTASLTGLTFTIVADTARGSNVYGAANRKNLLTLTQELCEAANLMQEITMDSGYGGYSYDVTTPPDHTLSYSGAVPFSVDWNNVEALEYIEDYTQYRNHHYVAGDGVGAVRNVTEVADAASVTADMRREAVIDARYATTANQRTSVGDLEVLKRARQLVTVKAKPFRAGANSVYRTDYDLGWTVTFAESGLRDDSIDVPIVAITVNIGANGNSPVEDIQFELGERMADSTVRRLLDAVSAMQASSLV